MKKVAVCLSGQMRHALVGIQSLRQRILAGVHADFFVCSYEGKALEEVVRLVDPRGVSIVSEELDIEITQIAHQRKYPETNLHNMFLMFRNVWKCFQLVEGDYSLVIRARTDQFFLKNMDLNNLGQDMYIPKGGDHRGGLLDHFCISSQRHMSYYADLFKYLNHYIDSGVIAHPETLLKHHIFFRQSTPIKVERIELPISLIRQQTNQAITLQHATPIF